MENSDAIINLRISLKSRPLLQAIIVCAILAAIARSAAFYGFCLIATKRLHDKMLRGVLESKAHFFDLNQTGRIVNRFLKDTGNIDDVLPLTLFDCMQVNPVNHLS